MIFVALVTYSYGQIESLRADKRLLAGWKIEQADDLGDVYYFYPDGLCVCQGVRRREFVTIGHWEMEGGKWLVLSDRQLLNTTLSERELFAIKATKVRYELNFENDAKMQWTVSGNSIRREELKRILDLPDRTENMYWGLGTDESYRRAIQRARDLRAAGSKEAPKQ